jgi:two-component system sensor histidine kinase HydH
VNLYADRGLDGMHDQMETVVQRVQTLVERMRALMRSEQLALAGRLACSIAHEIRNPLTAMKWLVDSAVKTYPDEPLRLQDLQVLQNEIDRMRQTVQGMLDFTRPPAPQRTHADLREVLHRAIALIRARKRQLGITCEMELPSHPVVANFDKSQIKSVVVNPLLNSLDAMPRGGRLQVRLVSNCPKSLVSVEDSGPGIPPEVLGRLFTPFTSTKLAGTGLGLSVSRRFVEEQGGELYAENRAEGGARFVMALPKP